MPKVSDMLFKPEPQFPPSGCHRCDGIRKLIGRPDVFCLRHDPGISKADRERYGVAYEQITAKSNQKEKDHAKNQ